MSPAADQELDAMVGRAHASACRCAKDVPVLVAQVRAQDKLLEMAGQLVRSHCFVKKTCLECLGEGGHKEWCQIGKLLAARPL